MGKENRAYIHSRLFSILKNRSNPAAYNNMDKPEEYCIKRSYTGT